MLGDRRCSAALGAPGVPNQSKPKSFDKRIFSDLSSGRVWATHTIAVPGVEGRGMVRRSAKLNGASCATWPFSIAAVRAVKGANVIDTPVRWLGRGPYRLLSVLIGWRRKNLAHASVTAAHATKGRFTAALGISPPLPQTNPTGLKEPDLPSGPHPARRVRVCVGMDLRARWAGWRLLSLVLFASAYLLYTYYSAGVPRSIRTLRDLVDSALALQQGLLRSKPTHHARAQHFLSEGGGDLFHNGGGAYPLDSGGKEQSAMTAPCAEHARRRVRSTARTPRCSRRGSGRRRSWPRGAVRLPHRGGHGLPIHRAPLLRGAEMFAPTVMSVPIQKRSPYKELIIYGFPARQLRRSLVS
ncbi:Protein of unknown function [Gryllus bimaculatus]|nr:Protein of unknown function [Gryllus bimaculatus]